jgi:uncharacterized membrane protein
MTLRRYLIAGLLVWVPLGITLYVFYFLVSTLDQTLLLVPQSLRPEALIGFRIPGLGVVLSFAILLLTGAVAANFFGARLILMWEALLGRIPFVKSIYSSVKQVSDTLLSDSGNAFRKALLVEFPYPGSWTIAFQTGSPATAVITHLQSEHVSVYVPTTPNPTSGYFVMLRCRVRRTGYDGRRSAQAHLHGCRSPRLFASRHARFTRRHLHSTTEIDRAGVRERLAAGRDRSVLPAPILDPMAIARRNRFAGD